MLSNSVFAIPASMDDIENDTALVHRLVEFTGLQPTTLAKRAGLAATTLTRPYKGTSATRLGIQTLEKLKRAFPAFPDWAVETGEAIDPHEREYLPVEILPSFAGLGGGGTGDGDPEYGMVPRRLIEDEFRAKAADFLLIDTRGDSAEPEFYHGDQILIDRRDRNPVQPGSFCLWDGDGYVVKGVERIPQRKGWYRVFSNNPKYQSYEAEEENIQIMGRPVWFARRL